MANLAARGIALQTLRRYGSLAAQRERMVKYGFGGSVRAESRNLKGPEEANGGIGVADVNHLWEKGVPAEEKVRVARLEMVDELEEWELLAAHYCVVWAWRDGDGEAADDGGKAGGGDGDGDEVPIGVKERRTGKGVWDGWRDVEGQEI